ncbi:hypothetical protein LGK97_00335 [Clostridium sp. CS001]|uniref:hypothetical protein n=1 Tax=Clostridium sp. CS001 TaxID=2880648 RepID=UPI001CF4190B|nr:hypothetical protein [Clostridium sp. CS001]MCB2288210.1 hypothetical protein [Clostridium sp. CS001]
MGMSMLGGLFSIVNLIFMLSMLGVSIYTFILFVKLAHRGIEALDIYINEKNKNTENFK